MKLIRMPALYSRKSEVQTVACYVTSAIDSQSDRDGAVESAFATANAAAEVLGRLIELLASKNQLTAKEVGAIVQGYAVDDITFVPDDTALGKS